MCIGFINQVLKSVEIQTHKIGSRVTQNDLLWNYLARKRTRWRSTEHRSLCVLHSVQLLGEETLPSSAAKIVSTINAGIEGVCYDSAGLLHAFSVWRRKKNASQTEFDAHLHPIFRAHSVCDVWRSGMLGAAKKHTETLWCSLPKSENRV